MQTSQKKENRTLNTILTLSGILLGVFLITKIKHQETCTTPLSKESDDAEKIEKPKVEIQKREVTVEGLNSRQLEILNVVKEKGIITPKDLQKLIPNISSRTLRRDMDALAKKKYVSQKGSTKSTFYKYIGR